MRPVIPLATAFLCAVALAACGGSSSSSQLARARRARRAPGPPGPPARARGRRSASQPTIGFEGVPLQTGPALAPASTTGTGKVDGITCGPTEQLVYHIHAHLAVFKNGQAYTLPAGVGIPGSHAVQTNQGPIASGGSCIYWLHTHTTDGVIHIESPSKTIYTLGNFFDEWHQPLSANAGGERSAARSRRSSTASRGRRTRATSRCSPTRTSSSRSGSRRRRSSASTGPRRSSEARSVSAEDGSRSRWRRASSSATPATITAARITDVPVPKSSTTSMTARSGQIAADADPARPHRGRQGVGGLIHR